MAAETTDHLPALLKCSRCGNVTAPAVGGGRGLRCTTGGCPGELDPDTDTAHADDLRGHAQRIIDSLLDDPSPTRPVRPETRADLAEFRGLDDLVNRSIALRVLRRAYQETRDARAYRAAHHVLELRRRLDLCPTCEGESGALGRHARGRRCDDCGDQGLRPAAVAYLDELDAAEEARGHA